MVELALPARPDLQALKDLKAVRVALEELVLQGQPVQRVLKVQQEAPEVQEQ